MAIIVRLEDFRRKSRIVYFSRADLDQLLSLFSRRVQAHEWLDYSIDNREGMAVFCVYRRAHDAPLYKIVKFAAGTQPEPDGHFLVMNGAMKLRQARTLAQVLQAFETPLRAIHP